MSPDSKMNTTEVETSRDAFEQSACEEQLTFLAAIKRYPKVVGWTLAVMTALLFVGFDTVVVGTITALPWFQCDFGDRSSEGQDAWILPASWIAMWSALGPVGAVLAGLFAGWYQDLVGRKWSIHTGSWTGVVAVAIMYCSNLPQSTNVRRGVFLASKLLQGGSVGILSASAQTYVSEVAPVSLRGPCMALFPTFILLGQLTGAVVIFISSRIDSPKSYLVSFATQWPFAALPLMLSVLIPESPVWLLQNDHIEAARNAYRRLHTSRIDLSSNLQDLQESVLRERNRNAHITYRHCFQGPDRKRTAIIILASLIPILFGLPLLANASYFMQQVGMAPTTSLLFLIIGIVLGFIANGIGTWILSRIGRRILTIVTMGLTTVLWGAVGISGIWQGNASMWYTAVSLMIVVVVCGFGCWPASFAVAAETSSLLLRARSQGISVLSAQIGNIVFQLVLPYLYNTDAADLKSLTGWVYAGICGMGTILCWMLIPEMKDRSIAEIDSMFEMRLSVRKFASHKAEAEGAR